MTPNLPLHADRPGGAGPRKGPGGGRCGRLSLYCKALDFFVPALHCECQAGVAGWVSHSQVAGFQKQLPFQNFVGDKTVGNLEFSALWDSRGVGVRQRSPRFRGLI